MISDKYKSSYLIAFSALFTIAFITNLQYEKGDFLLLVNAGRLSIFDLTMPYITHIGDGLFFAVIILLFLIVKWRIGVLYLVTGLVTLLASNFFKRIVFNNEPRPKKYFSQLDVNLDFIPGVEVHSNFSFPSGHTMSAVAMTSILAFTVVKNSYQAVGLAIIAWIAGFSRIYLLQHFLRDVVAGAAIGLIISVLTYYSLKSILKINSVSSR